MYQTALPRNGRQILSRSWIISSRDDLVWFIGSVAASYLLLFAYLNLGISVVLLVWIWALGFDGPHVFATISRTYADSEERRQRARLLYGSLLLFLLGPSMVLAGQARLLGVQAWGSAFFLFASLWAYYHLVKQHYGFMILYKKKNRDLAEIDNLMDRALLLLGMAYPLFYFMNNAIGAAGRTQFLRETGLPGWLEVISLFGFVMALLLFAGRQVQNVLGGRTINLPKVLLLAAAIPMHWIVLRTLVPSPEGALAAVAMLTIYHNIQYNRIVWFHNRNKYNRDASGDHGAASFISRSLFRFALLAALFGAAYHIPHYTLIPPDGLAMSFFWGGAFVHYYLDGKIWRVRRDERLGHSLKISESRATT